MRNLRAPFFGLATVLFLFACKKNDMQAPVTPSHSDSALSVASTQGVKSVSGWQTISDWKVATQPNFTLYYSSISNAAINTSIAASGLVLVYKKDANNTIIRLPFEEKNGSQLANYWYYQVSNGKILITRDSYTNAQATAQNNFQYVVFTADQLNKLTQKGYDRSKLMNLPYTDL